MRVGWGEGGGGGGKRRQAHFPLFFIPPCNFCFSTLKFLFAWHFSAVYFLIQRLRHNSINNKVLVLALRGLKLFNQVRQKTFFTHVFVAISNFICMFYNVGILYVYFIFFLYSQNMISKIFYLNFLTQNYSLMRFLIF